MKSLEERLSGAELAAGFLDAEADVLVNEALNWKNNSMICAVIGVKSSLP